MAIQLATATDELWDRWPYLSHEQRLKQFRELHTGEKADFFLALNAHDQYNLLLGLPEDQRHVWMRLLAPDDAADVIQQAGPEEREELLALLDEPTRKEVVALLAYKEDEAGGLMNPRFARNVNPAFTPKGLPQSGLVVPPTTQRSIGDLLTANNIPWKYYGNGFNASGTGGLLDSYCNICN